MSSKSRLKEIRTAVESRFAGTTNVAESANYVRENDLLSIHTESLKVISRAAQKRQKAFDAFLEADRGLETAFEEYARVITPLMQFSQLPACLKECARFQMQVNESKMKIEMRAEQLLGTQFDAFIQDVGPRSSAVKKSYEKTLREFDAAITKVKLLRQSKKVTPEKLREAEADLQVAKEAFERAEKETVDILKQTNLRSEITALNNLLQFIDSQNSYFKMNYNYVETVQPKLERYKNYLDHASNPIDEAKTKVFKVPIGDLAKREGRRVPRIVVACTQYVMDHMLTTQGVFRISAIKDELEDLKAQLDRGTFPKFKIQENYHTPAGILKLFLREMPDPLFTFDLYDEFVSAGKIRDSELQLQELKRLVDKLPLVNKKTLQHIAKMCHAITEKSEINKMNAANLAIVLCPNCLYSRNVSDPINMVQEMEVANNIFCKIISNYSMIYPKETEEDLEQDIYIHSEADEIPGNSGNSPSAVVPTSPPMSPVTAAQKEVQSAPSTPAPESSSTVTASTKTRAPKLRKESRSMSTSGSAARQKMLVNNSSVSTRNLDAPGNSGSTEKKVMRPLSILDVSELTHRTPEEVQDSLAAVLAAAGPSSGAPGSISSPTSPTGGSSSSRKSSKRSSESSARKKKRSTKAVGDPNLSPRPAPILEVPTEGESSETRSTSDSALIHEHRRAATDLPAIPARLVPPPSLLPPPPADGDGDEKTRSENSTPRLGSSTSSDLLSPETTPRLLPPPPEEQQQQQGEDQEDDIVEMAVATLVVAAKPVEEPNVLVASPSKTILSGRPAFMEKITVPVAMPPAVIRIQPHQLEPEEPEEEPEEQQENEEHQQDDPKSPLSSPLPQSPLPVPIPTISVEQEQKQEKEEEESTSTTTPSDSAVSDLGWSTELVQVAREPPQPVPEVFILAAPKSALAALSHHISKLVHFSYATGFTPAEIEQLNATLRDIAQYSRLLASDLNVFREAYEHEAARLVASAQGIQLGLRDVVFGVKDLIRDVDNIEARMKLGSNSQIYVTKLHDFFESCLTGLRSNLSGLVSNAIQRVAGIMGLILRGALSKTLTVDFSSLERKFRAETEEFVRFVELRGALFVTNETNSGETSIAAVASDSALALQLKRTLADVDAFLATSSSISTNADPDDDSLSSTIRTEAKDLVTSLRSVEALIKKDDLQRFASAEAPLLTDELNLKKMFVIVLKKLTIVRGAESAEVSGLVENAQRFISRPEYWPPPDMLTCADQISKFATELLLQIVGEKEKDEVTQEAPGRYMRVRNFASAVSLLLVRARINAALVALEMHPDLERVLIFTLMRLVETILNLASA